MLFIFDPVLILYLKMIFPSLLISTARVVMVWIKVKMVGGCSRENDIKKSTDSTLNDSTALSSVNIESTSSSSEITDEVISRSMHIKPL